MKVSGFDLSPDGELIDKKATYADIKAWVKETYGLTVSNLAIAQTKEAVGLSKSPYKGVKASGKYAEPKLRKDKAEAILKAFKHFGMM